MKNINIIYWSGTGNTQMMANALAEGIKNISVKVLEVKDATLEDVLEADAVALGCPSMGVEVLEEDEMEPFIANIERENLKGKPMILFGSYGWGDGEWMRDWEDRMGKADVQLIGESFIVQETPTEDDLLQCKKLGRQIADTLLEE
ncbi:MAG: flavodoxin [Eubacteriales bacterium]